MIIQMEQNAKNEHLQKLINLLEKMRIETNIAEEQGNAMLVLKGDTSFIDEDILKTMPGVKSVKRIKEPYKNASKRVNPQGTVVEVNGAKIGGSNFAVIAGPCSVESEEQIIETAKAVKVAGAQVLRGGAYKMRTSPYTFQGLGEEGIKLLLLAKKETSLPIVTELTDLSKLEQFEEVDILQVGARNMQNFEMLKELGKIDKPVILKRGISATLEEWLLSAEYILSGGNQKVILCERGIRTFETATRNTMDISAIPVLKELTHLPIIADPSHATGSASLVTPMALAATAAGANGLMIEVHTNPECALCDGPQAINTEEFSELMEKVKIVRKVVK